MSDVDCMTCLVKLAHGCPSSGAMLQDRGVCARVRTVTNEALTDRVIDLPAHLFEWSAVAGRWMSFKGLISRWATREQ